MPHDLLERGFSEPVFAAQSTFRVVMDALARPGTVLHVPADIASPAPMGRAMAAIVLTLCDYDTPVWLDVRLSSVPSLAQWLRLQTGATVVSDPGHAAFALVSDAVAMPQFSDFPQGTQEYPDRSATLVVEVDGFGDGMPMALEGPGIAGAASIAPHPLPAGLLDQLARNRAAFPRGIDLLLTAGDAVVGLPRTTRVTRG